MAKQSSKDVSPTVAEPTTSRALSPFDDFDRFFDSFFDRGWMQPFGPRRPAWAAAGSGMLKAPKVDVVDRDKDILIRAEIPGIDRKDLDISVTDNSVTLKGESRQEKREEKGDYYRSEITQGAFSRTIALPCEVDADKADAKLADGMLEMTIPKVRETSRRKVEVK